MPRPHARTVAFAFASALVFASAGAAAQGSSIAEQLFVEGRALMQAGKHAEACAKFKASHDLDHTSTGTLLNLALCHEQTGKLATAWAEFRQVAAESAGRREDRVAIAKEHEEKLAPLLAHVRIDVPQEVRVPGLSLQLDDGDPMSEGTWGVEVPIDSGDHVLVATAPGKLASKVKFQIPRTPELVGVTVPALVDAPPDPPPIDTKALERQNARRTRRIVGGVLAGAGVVAFGVALGFGAKASSDNSDAEEACPEDRCVDVATQQRATDSLSNAKSAALVANVLAAAGGGLVLGGAVLILTSLGGDKKKESAWRVLPTAGPTGAGLGLSRSF